MKAALLGLALVGCAALERPVPEFGAGTCDAAAASGLVGQMATADVVDKARRSTRSKAVRVIAPGTMVTMDYRSDRLNLEVDERRVVTRVRCG